MNNDGLLLSVEMVEKLERESFHAKDTNPLTHGLKPVRCLFNQDYAME